ncbi:MAG TPA: LLM class flavin-dependent oxidoreductase, partial [Thermoleophilaceae bacterium]|nr:LLM class flavin-dependent oxidoreductase [Thermoleophilaceae bacterium]
MAAIGDRVALGVGLPQVFADAPVDRELIRRYAARAEALGFTSLWVQEGFLTPAPYLDPLELLSFVSPLTSSVRLGVSVIVLARHEPVVLAKRLTTLDHLSGGRLVIGLGVGPPHEDFGRALEPQARPRERFVEGMRLLDALWGGRPVTHDGRIWRVEGGAMSPRPLQEPRPPLWFGGRHPAALRRAARLADGWMGAGSSTIAAFTEQAATMRDELERAGRDRTGCTFSKRVYIGLDDDAARAARRWDEYRTGVYGSNGPPAEV